MVYCIACFPHFVQIIAFYSKACSSFARGQKLSSRTESVGHKKAASPSHLFPGIPGSVMKRFNTLKNRPERNNTTTPDGKAG